MSDEPCPWDPECIAGDTNHACPRYPDDEDNPMDDPCDYCPHGRPEHGGDGCDRCGCTWPL